MVSVFVVAGAVVAAALAPTAQAASDDGTSASGSRDMKCSQTSLPVSLMPSGPVDQTVWGELCVPVKETKPKTVHVLVAGATYDHNYWDFPYKSSEYSYVRHAVQDGSATFAMDRVGTGGSSQPVSDLVDLRAAGHTIHQVVRALRSGEVRGSGSGFSRVVAAGHSMGSAAIWHAAATYRGIDGVIVTGLTHRFNSDGKAAVQAATVPANVFPEWAGRDGGYLTTSPGSRGIFYNVNNADPKVMEKDESLKQPFALGEIITLEQMMADDTSARIKVPVLLVMGEKDSVFCGGDAVNCTNASALRAAEAPHYAGARSFTTHVVQGAGHNTNLHRGADSWFEAATKWVDRHVAR